MKVESILTKWNLNFLNEGIVAKQCLIIDMKKHLLLCIIFSHLFQHPVQLHVKTCNSFIIACFLILKFTSFIYYLIYY